MSIKSTCPHCGSSVTVPDQLLGKKVRCKKCAETFLAEDLDDEAEEPDEEEERIQPEPRSSRPITRPSRRDEQDDEDDEDEPRRKKPAEKSSTGLILMILGGVFAFLLLACCLPAGYFFYQFKVGYDEAMDRFGQMDDFDDFDDPPDDIGFPPKPPPNWPPVNPPPPPVIPAGPLTIDDALADLRDGDAQRRRRGADWLKRAPVDFGRQIEVNGALEPLLVDNDHRVRTSALEGLAVWATPQNVPALLKVLTEEKQGSGLVERQRLAISTLGRLRDSRAAPVIAPHLVNPSTNEDARKALQAIGRAAEKDVLKHYHHPDAGFRDHARQLLQGYGTTPRAITDQSLEDLKAPDPTRRRSAVEWFVQTPADEQVRPAVAQALNPLLAESDTRLSDAALRALATWATRDNVPTLLTLLPEGGAKSRPSRVRHQVIEILARLKDERAIPALAQRLTTTTDRTQAAAALRSFGPPAAKEVAKYLEHPDRATRDEAARLLKTLGGNEGGNVDLTRHLNGLKANDALARREALLWFAKAPVDNGKRAEAAQALQARLTDSDAGTRELALKALVVWGGKEDVPGLIRLVDDPSAGVRHLAIDTVAKLKDPRGAGPVAQRLTHILDREVASKALQTMGPIAETDVASLLGNQDRLVRIEACKVLRVIGTNASLPALQTAVQNALKMKQQDVADAATQAMAAIKRRS